MRPTALTYRLTDEQRVQLAADALSFVEQYRGEMRAGFWPKRHEFEKQANGDFSARLSATGDRIFDLSNDSLNIVRNVTRFMKARCGEDIFGSKPWFSATPVGGAADAALADQINRHGPWKLGEAQYGRHGKEAIGLALDLGEAVLKTTHRTDLDCYEKLTLVLVNTATGQPVVTQQGDYVYPEDGTFIDADSGAEAYEKAPEIPAGAGTEFREVLIENEDTAYHGADVAVLRFDGFIAPLNVPSLDLAPAVAHEFTRTVSELRALYGNDDEETEAMFHQLECEPDGPKTPDEQPRTTHGEISATAQRIVNNPRVKVTEVYLRGYDVFGDGKGRNIFMVFAANLDEPLFVEYLANVTVRGRLPFHAIAVNRVPGRWYGRGFYELYQGEQGLIDALLNAVLYRNMNNADPMICWQPDAVEEGVAGEQRLVRRPGKTFTLRPGKTAKDAVQIIEFPDLDTRTWELIQLLMQLIQTDSGVTSAAQGDYSALPSASTATGVSSILQSASTLHRMLTEDLKDGFEPAVLFALMTIYAHQDKDETYQYLEGKAAEVMSLASAKALAQLAMNVRLLLTRFQMKEQRESALAIITGVLPAWISALQVSGLPTDDVAAEARVLFIQVVKGSGIDHAEQMFVLPQRPPPAPQPSAKVTESMNYKDTPEDIKRQMEQAAGFTPSALPPPAPADKAGAGEAAETAPPALPSNVIPDAKPEAPAA